MIALNLEIKVQYHYLHLPIRSGSEKIALQLVCDGKVVREFDAELALMGKRDWWGYYDLSSYLGKKITLRSVDPKFTSTQASLLSQLITQSDDLLYTQDLYQERYRPQLRFTPKRGWSNDPNGMIYAQGTWHLFFQHNPFSTQWGTMHWGHATSSDLVHWTEQEIILYPRSIQDAPWSGGAVLDSMNTSGLQSGNFAPLVLSFTSTGRGECLAYSLDQGETFQEYQGNPILKHKGRDPKIIWYPPQQKWIMILYEEGNDQRGYDFYESPDLLHWKWLQHLPGWFECPEFFTLPVDGANRGENRWVVYGSIFNGMQSAFLLGSFDGKEFHAEREIQIGHAGPHFYAAQVFSNAPDDRKIMMGWLRDANYPEMPFGNGMSIPLELSLRKVENHVRLCFYPVKEFENLRSQSWIRSNKSPQEVNSILSEIDPELIDMELTIETQAGKPFQVNVGGYIIAYQPFDNEVTLAGQTVLCQPGKKEVHLRVVVDRSVMEVFVDHGWGAFASMTIFGDNGRKVEIEGDILVSAIEVYELESIWK